MTRHKAIGIISIVCCLLAGMAASCGSRLVPPYTTGVRLQLMKGFPSDEPGISLGVSACYAGMIHGRLLLAGGCNFPEISAAEGGKKHFYRGIYIAEILNDSVLSWQKMGELPVAAAYGVSISTPEGVICIGGTGEYGAMSSVYRLDISQDNGILSIDTLPSLPVAIDNMSGALLNDTILFVAGGNINGSPSNSLFTLDLTNLNAGWQAGPDFPGDPRVQSVCAAAHSVDGESRFFLWGGFAASTPDRSATLSTDGYSYSLMTRQWQPVATPASTDSIVIALGGGVAVTLNDSLILCTGGVNKDIFLSALRREEMLKKAITVDDQLLADSLKTAGKTYLSHPVDWYRFNDKVLVYNARQNTWQEVACQSELARAGAALVGEKDKFFSINGELKPGIRTPKIYRIIIE